MENALVPAALPQLLRAVHAALVEHRDEIDALNVFPVPDGDTGSNLVATSQAIVAALGPDALPVDGPALVRAAMRSARGNSGVIFSQVVRAVVDTVIERDAADPGSGNDVAVLAAALQRADELAREAVAEPVEGTILTALRVAAATAASQMGSAPGSSPELIEVVDHVLADVSAAVLRTREQLDVLRDAGVVDAGARGFEVVVAAIQGVLRGAPVLVAPLGQVVPRCVDATLADVHANPFEVQFVLTGDSGLAVGLRTSLSDLGDSVVVVAAEGLVSAHVHTSAPDDALATGRQLGELQDVRVVDLRESLTEPAEIDVVAVLPAGGLADLGRASGAAVVDGAAGSLPSVDDILRASRSCPGDRVVVLPGHANAIPTARQAATLAAREGRVLEIVGQARHPLVVLAVLALGTADPDECRATASSCRAGEVVAAVRDASTPVGAVVAGQPLVVVDGAVVAVEDDVSQALATLLGHLDASTAEVVTVAVGATTAGDAPAGMDIGQVMMVVAEHAGDAEVEVLDGGQRPALLLVAVE